MSVLPPTVVAKPYRQCVHLTLIVWVSWCCLAGINRSIHGLLLTHRDMPPSGGFQAIRYTRSLPFRGPSGAVIFGGMFAICGYGFYVLGQGIKERR